MDSWFLAGIVISILLALFALGEIFYFTDLYLNKRDRSTVSNRIMWVVLSVAVSAFVCVMIITSDIAVRFIALGAGLLLLAIFMVITCIRDLKHGFGADVDFKPRTHLAFLGIVLLLPLSFILGFYCDNKIESYRYTNGETKVIDYVAIIPVEVTNYEWVDGGHAEVAIPRGKKTVEHVYLITTDGEEIFISKKYPDKDYALLYPHGDTVRVYNGKLVKLR